MVPSIMTLRYYANEKSCKMFSEYNVYNKEERHFHCPNETYFNPGVQHCLPMSDIVRETCQFLNLCNLVKRPLEQDLLDWEKYLEKCANNSFYTTVKAAMEDDAIRNYQRKALEMDMNNQTKLLTILPMQNWLLTYNGTINQTTPLMERPTLQLCYHTCKVKFGYNETRVIDGKCHTNDCKIMRYVGDKRTLIDDCFENYDQGEYWKNGRIIKYNCTVITKYKIDDLWLEGDAKKIAQERNRDYEEKVHLRPEYLNGSYILYNRTKKEEKL